MNDSHSDQDKAVAIPKYEPSQNKGQLRQGEILTNLVQSLLDVTTIGSQEPVIVPMLHPYAIVVSQDCDLDWDYKARWGQDANDIKSQNKLVPNILFCIVTEAEKLRKRDSHFPKNVSREINSSVWDQIENNKHERYHFLESPKHHQDSLGTGLPELGIDFKRYFTMPTEEVYKRIESGEAKRRCRLISPYREHLITRFYYFQLRVALPEDHYSEP